MAVISRGGAVLLAAALFMLTPTAAMAGKGNGGVPPGQAKKAAAAAAAAAAAPPRSTSAATAPAGSGSAATTSSLAAPPAATPAAAPVFSAPAGAAVAPASAPPAAVVVPRALNPAPAGAGPAVSVPDPDAFQYVETRAPVVTPPSGLRSGGRTPEVEAANPIGAATVTRPPVWLPSLLTGLLAGLLILLVTLVVRARRHAEAKVAFEMAKVNFLSGASHELRTPLSVVRGYLSMASEGLMGTLPPELSKALPQMNARAADLDRMIDGMLFAAELAAAPRPALHTVDLRELVTQAAFRGRAGTAARLQVRVEVPGEAVMVRVEPEELGRAVTELVERGLRPSQPTLVVRCRVTATHDDAKIVVLAPPTPVGGPKSELGLELVNQVALRHHGQLVVDHLPVGSTEYRLQLPRA